MIRAYCTKHACRLPRGSMHCPRCLEQLCPGYKMERRWIILIWYMLVPGTVLGWSIIGVLIRNWLIGVE
jgi:hypothetical protein